MAHLSILVAEFGEDIPYVGGLARGFPFHGTRVPFINYQKGIYRAAIQTGPAALSIQTSAKSPYDDEILADGFLYAYRAGSIEQPDNRALVAAHNLQVPLVYFIGTRPGWYKPVFPCFVSGNDARRRMVTVTPGELRGPVDEPIPMRLEDPMERRYAVRQIRVRLHQARFRARVVPAYSSQCYVVHVSRRLREDEDGPMLELLKGFHDRPLIVPTRARDRPDRERLDARFAEFRRMTA